MMNESPLEQVRQAEAAVAARIHAAQESTVEDVAQAHVEAKQIKQAALEDGRQEGKAEYVRLIREAELEAEQILEQTRDETERLERILESSINPLAEHALGFILGSGEEYRNNES